MSTQRGFTLIELILASVFLSFVLLMAAYAFVQVNRAFNQGQTVKIIQETARIVMEDMARELTLAGDKQITIVDDDAAPGNRRLCIGELRYAWNEGIYYEDTTASDTTNPTPAQLLRNGNLENFSLIKETQGVTDCTSTPPITWNGYITDLIPKRASVLDIEISKINDAGSNAGQVYRLSLTLSTRTKDLVDNPADPTECDPTKGTTYCDIVHLETAVSVR